MQQKQFVLGQFKKDNYCSSCPKFDRLCQSLYPKEIIANLTQLVNFKKSEILLFFKEFESFIVLVMDSNNSTKNKKEKNKGSRENVSDMAVGKKKRKKNYVPYDYEAAYSRELEQMHEWFIEQMLKYRKKVIYALKEITSGSQFEIEIYPQFRSMDEVPKEGRYIKKDNSRAQRNLNDKNARKYVERLINTNFTDKDIWLTLTYDEEHVPEDGDIDAAIKNVQKYIRRVNYQRKKRGLPNAKYVYVTEYNPDAEIRWHHHIVMDGLMDMETVESCWKQASRNQIRRLQKDEKGYSGLANYIVKEKERIRSEKRWTSSQGLQDPDIRVVHSKRPAAGGSYKKIGSFVNGMVKNQNTIPEVLRNWYPNFDFTEANVYYNEFNSMFYIHARMRKQGSG